MEATFTYGRMAWSKTTYLEFLKVKSYHFSFTYKAWTSKTDPKEDFYFGQIYSNQYELYYNSGKHWPLFLFVHYGTCYIGLQISIRTITFFFLFCFSYVMKAKPSIPVYISLLLGISFIFYPVFGSCLDGISHASKVSPSNSCSSTLYHFAIIRFYVQIIILYVWLLHVLY